MTLDEVAIAGEQIMDRGAQNKAMIWGAKVIKILQARFALWLFSQE